MHELKFLQISDLHLGAPFGWLTPDRRRQRHLEQQRALETIVGLAVERRADAILVPGDLFDEEGVGAETLAFAVHAFATDGCPPVFITPGNHDPASRTSPYWNPRLLAGRGWAWPAHVTVFGGPAWTGHALDGVPVTVWGRCFTSGLPSAERPLAAASLRPAGPFDPGRLHIALFHGSLEERCPPGQKITAPFSEHEVRASPFAYHAVGHYHAAMRLDAGDGEPATGVRLAYAGSALALGAAETGEHGALEVRIEPGAGAPRITVEPVVLDPRRVHAFDVDVTGCASADAIDRRAQEALAARGATPADIVRVRLTGRIVRGVRYVAPGPELAAAAFSLRIDARAVRPDYDIDEMRVREPATTEDLFVRILAARIDAERDPDRRAVLTRALHYGLDAFRLHEVAPACEEVDA